MRILLSQSAFGLQPTSGGHKANWALLKGYQQDGHTVKLIANVKRKELEEEKIDFEATVLPFPNNEKFHVYKFTFDGLDFVAHDSDDLQRIILHKKFFPTFLRWLQKNEEIDEFTILQNFFSQVADEYQPTHYFVNDSTSLKFSEAIQQTAVRIFIIHSTEHLPFGPDLHFAEGFSGTRSEAETKRLADVDCVWSVSKAIGEYAQEYGNIQYTHVPIHPLIYGEIPECRHNWNAEFVVAINPGLIKGFAILYGLARAMPNTKFAAVASWDFTSHLAEELKTLSNVTVLPPFSDMDELWERTRVLLVPTMWFEAFGLVSVEAMLRGIPVLASDQGGLPEAKLGVDYTIPVAPLVPLPKKNPPPGSNEGGDADGYLVPKQNIEPWVSALKEVLGDQEKYEALAKSSREASVEYVEGIDRKQYSKLLEEAWEKKFGAKEMEN